jgi:ribosomal protein S27AE
MDSLETVKRAARRALAEAVFDGLIEPPARCPRCGEHTIITAHHKDYGKPLDVDWLCHWCHFCEHQRQLGLPVPARRRSRVPVYRPPRVRAPARRTAGRPRARERYLRERPESQPRTYGELLGRPIVRRNGRPALREPGHQLARGDFVYVEDLILFERLGRPRQIGDLVTYRDGNCWNWDPRNVDVYTRPADPHVFVEAGLQGRADALTCEYATFRLYDLDEQTQEAAQSILWGSQRGHVQLKKGWTLREARRLCKQLHEQGIPVRVDPRVEVHWRELAKRR